MARARVHSRWDESMEIELDPALRSIKSTNRGLYLDENLLHA